MDNKKLKLANLFNLASVLLLSSTIQTATAKPLADHRDISNLFSRRQESPSIDGCLADDQCICGDLGPLCNLDMSWVLDPVVAGLIGNEINSNMTETSSATEMMTTMAPTTTIPPEVITTSSAVEVSSSPPPPPAPPVTSEAPPAPPQPVCPISNDEHWPSCEECPDWEPSPDRCIAGEFSAACSCPDPCGHVNCIY